MKLEHDLMIIIIFKTIISTDISLKNSNKLQINQKNYNNPHKTWILFLFFGLFWFGSFPKWIFIHLKGLSNVQLNWTDNVISIQTEVCSNLSTIEV